jgi:hypothetical protein
MHPRVKKVRRLNLLKGELLDLMKKLRYSSGMEMLALAALALTMVAWLGHPPRTLLHLTPLLQQIHKMIKKVKKAEKKATTSQACRRTPQHLFGA